MAKCKNCETELTEMKDGKNEFICFRCLNCHPLTTYVKPEDKATRYVDIPWTEERIIEVIDKVVPDMIRDILNAKNDTIDGKPELSHVEVVPEDNWREQAKKLGIPLSQETGGARKKVDVLKDIQERTNVESSD